MGHQFKEDRFDVAYRVLDDDVIDADGRRCGKVDDIEIDGRAGEPAYLSALLVGPGAWPGRLPAKLERLAARIFRSETVRVPWSEVDDITAVVKLKKKAGELRLGTGDDKARPLLEWLPRS
jgi:sporulation protein YlmC with PRC-barrel domain